MKPFLKWVGGKRSKAPFIVDKILQLVPCPSFYYEPMLGGGAVFFELFDRATSPIKYILGDLNGKLINCYKMVEMSPRSVHSYLVNFFENIDSDSYYELRDAINGGHFALNGVGAAAAFLYLNRVGYRGLYRENKSGKINTPYGHYNKVSCPDFDQLLKISDALRTASIDIEDYREITLPDISDPSHTVIYLDPPYHNAYSQYTKEGFDSHEFCRRVADFTQYAAVFVTESIGFIDLFCESVSRAERREIATYTYQWPTHQRIHHGKVGEAGEEGLYIFRRRGVSYERS